MPKRFVSQILGRVASQSSRRNSNCGMTLDKPSSSQTKVQISDYAYNLAKAHTICSAAVNILADIVVADGLDRDPRATLVRVGQVNRKGVRITANILGATRIDGGLVLLTWLGGGRSSHRVYLLDDLYRRMNLNRQRTGCPDELWELVLKAVARRNQILGGTTNYFSGITGKVIKRL